MIRDVGTNPYILGPFTSKVIELLKSKPPKTLEIPDLELDKINKIIRELKL